MKKFYYKLVILLALLSCAAVVGIMNTDLVQATDYLSMKATALEQAEAIENDDSLSESEKANRLAEIGKWLLEHPKTAYSALSIFERALSHDEQHGEANFYASFLKPIDVLKGYCYKLRQIVGEEYLQERMADLLSPHYSQHTREFIREFLRNESDEQPFQTVSEAQSYLVTVLLPELEISEERLLRVEHQSGFVSTFNHSFWHRFFTQPNTRISFDQVEARSLRVGLKGIASLVKMVSAYNLDVVPALVDRFNDRDEITFQEVVEAITQHPLLGTLHDGADERLMSVLDEASESIEGLRIIARLLNTAENRGAFLLEPFQDQEEYINFTRLLNTISDFMSGPTALTMFARRNAHAEVVFDATALLFEPISDLKTLLPTAFDASGRHATEFPDLTFGQMFPDADFISTYCALTNGGGRFAIAIRFGTEWVVGRRRIDRLPVVRCP